MPDDEEEEDDDDDDDDDDDPESLSLSLSLDDESDDESDDDDDESEDEPESCSPSCFACSSRFGAFLSASRMSSVSAPRPMVVKKLMEKRVSLGLSTGNRPAKADCSVGSRSRAISASRPMADESSRKSSLM